MSALPRIVIVSVTAALLGACSSIDLLPEQKTDYQQARSAPTLELPPDLTISDAESQADASAAASGSASYSDYSSGAGTQASAPRAVMPEQPGIELKRDAQTRWLAIDAAPDAVWNRMRDFWIQNGFLIKREDPRIGILETDWAENRADIPQDPIRNVLKKAFDWAYSAPTRDQFRVRLEAGSDGVSTELYLSHRGVVEVVQGESTRWQARPADPELEAEMLRRLMVFFGTREDEAGRQIAEATPAAPQARMVQGADGRSEIILGASDEQAWRRVGVALDRVGLLVEDRDRAQGIYQVRYSDPLKAQEEKGILSSLAFWEDDAPARDQDQFRIKLAPQQGDGVHITVLRADGTAEDTETGKRILTLLHEQLR
jgi:outer membrane protein assembly factor BamC